MCRAFRQGCAEGTRGLPCSCFRPKSLFPVGGEGGARRTGGAFPAAAERALFSPAGKGFFRRGMFGTKDRLRTEEKKALPGAGGQVARQAAIERAGFSRRVRRATADEYAGEGKILCGRTRRSRRSLARVSGIAGSFFFLFRLRGASFLCRGRNRRREKYGPQAPGRRGQGCVLRGAAPSCPPEKGNGGVLSRQGRPCRASCCTFVLQVQFLAGGADSPVRAGRTERPACYSFLRELPFPTVFSGRVVLASARGADSRMPEAPGKKTHGRGLRKGAARARLRGLPQPAARRFLRGLRGEGEEFGLVPEVFPGVRGGQRQSLRGRGERKGPSPSRLSARSG